VNGGKSAFPGIPAFTTAVREAGGIPYVCAWGVFGCDLRVSGYRVDVMVPIESIHLDKPRWFARAVGGLPEGDYGGDSIGEALALLERAIAVRQRDIEVINAENAERWRLP
jgi:hypothetical protein